MSRGRGACLLSLAMATVLAGCGDPDVQLVRIAVRSPQLNAWDIASVVVAVLHAPDKECVSSSASSKCSGIPSVEAARGTSGYLMQQTLSITTGSQAFFDDLPEGNTCFVAEAFGAPTVEGPRSLGAGCREVEMNGDKPLIEIEISEGS